MNTTYLKTLLAIRTTGSFADASDLMNLSHSAVSVQMKRLEGDLGRDLFYKGRRPAQFTPFGTRFCEMATSIVADIDRLMRSGSKNSVEGTIHIGFVSTTLQTLLPVMLDKLALKFPKLRVRAVSGLSDDIALRVEREELDFGFVSASSSMSELIHTTEFAKEPLKIIAPPGVSPDQPPFDLFCEMPFIGFTRRSRLGSQISQSLREYGVRVSRLLELDSIDAIENLVAQGRGISIVPQRVFATKLEHKLRTFDFPVKANYRVLSLISALENDRNLVRQALLKIRV